MQNKKLVIGTIVVVAFLGLVMATRNFISAGKGKKGPAAAVSGKAAAKKVISKGKGGLTVKILNSKNAEIPMRVKMFKSVSSDTSIYAASTAGGRMQELTPGTYDIEIDTIPQEIIKNVKVSEGKETVQDLGCVTGSLIVRVINAKKAPAYYPLRVLYSKNNEMVTAFMTNKTLEIIPGGYDIEIGTSPRQYKKDVKIEAGKETIVDMGCLTGVLVVKTVDENKKDMRCSARITKADTNEMVTAAISNRPVELTKGEYNVEILTLPKQNKKGIKVEVGEESVAEFTVVAPIIAPKNAPTALKPPAPKAQPVKAKK